MIRTAERVGARGPPRPAAAAASTTSCCSRCRATRSSALAAIVRETMEGALPLSVPLTVDVKVGDDWESMTPLTREDAIAAEADELPLEAPLAPIAGVGVVGDARAARGRDRRARPAPADHRRDDRRRDDALGADAARRSTPRRSRTASPGRRIEAVGRRGEAARRRAVRRRVPDDPPEDDRPAVRRAARAARGSVRPARARARGRPRDPVPRHPQVRAGRAVRRRTTADPFATTGPGAAGRRVHGRGVPAADPRPARAGSSRSCSTRRSSPASATSTPTRRSGRRASTRCGRPGRCGRADERRLWRELRRILAEAVTGAARRSTTTRRPTATARCRSTSRSTSGPASRACAAAGRSGGSSSAAGRRTSARGASACRRPTGPGRGAILADDVVAGAARAGAGRSCRAGRGASG